MKLRLFGLAYWCILPLSLALTSVAFLCLASAMYIFKALPHMQSQSGSCCDLVLSEILLAVIAVCASRLCFSSSCRSTEDLYLHSPISEAAAALWRLPLIYIIFNFIRFLFIFSLRPLFKLLHRRGHACKDHHM